MTSPTSEARGAESKTSAEPGTNFDLLTSAEVAALLRVPVTTVYYWRETKRGPRGAQVGKQVLYDRADVVAWWNQRLNLDRSAS